MQPRLSPVQSTNTGVRVYTYIYGYIIHNNNIICSYNDVTVEYCFRTIFIFIK